VTATLALVPEEAFELDGVVVVRATPRAILFECPELLGEDGAPVPTWCPKSCIHETSQVRDEGDEGRLVVMRWFAEGRRWF
jgi:hypothetical protein